MKKLILTILFLGFLNAANSQQELKQADQYFERAFYSDAIPLYEQLLPRNKSSKLIKNIADSYYHTFNMKAAARWYSYLNSNYRESMDEEYHFRLNQSLKAIGENDKANQIMFDKYQLDKDTLNRKKLKLNIKYLENISAIGQRFEIKNLNINTGLSEFGASAIDSNLMYSATKKRKGKTYRWNNQNYLDIYQHKLEDLMKGDSLSIPISPNINSKMHEGTFAISNSRKTIFFTRNSKTKTFKKISNLKIYSAEWQDGDWNNITELSFNSDEFSTEHPALNADETKLYFASDRPGGLGSFDLYYVDIKPNAEFGNPINLGSMVNTDQKEQFPFLDLNNNLYFSSNGHPGFGLMDIFISKNLEGIFQKPDNIGLPINSGYDDFSWYIGKDEKNGFFSSNRPSGKGSDDIYAFTKTKELIIEDCKQFISGTLIDKSTKLPLAKGKIELFDLNGNLLSSLITNAEGAFQFDIACSSSYVLVGKKNRYKEGSKNISTLKERDKTYDGSLELLSLKEIKNQRLALEKKKKDEQLLKEKKRKDEQLSKEKKRKDDEVAAIQKEKINAEKKRVNLIDTVIKTEGSIIKEKERTIIKTKEIHFDYSLWYLRRETRERLADLIELLKKYPDLKIEIGSHTDIRGRSDYNRTLSQKRAESVKEYLVKKGIDTDRLRAKGYGESQPIVKCKSESDCTEEDHEWNRRCEFVISNW